MRRGYRQFLYVVGALLVVPLFIAAKVGYYFYSNNYSVNLRKHAPILNPDPKIFLTLSGYISPKLDGKVYLSFVQTYATASMQDKCLHEADPYSGLQEGVGVNIVYRPKPNKQGHYVLRIPLDKYLPGKCDWQPLNMGYSLNKKFTKNPNGEGFLAYGKSNQSHNPRIYNLVCQNTPQSCIIKIPKNSYAVFLIQPNESYNMKFNLLFKGENNEHGNHS